MTSVIKTAPANSTSYQNLVKVTGVSGTLTAVGVAHGWRSHYVRIAIDGDHVVEDLLVGSNAAQAAANGGLGVALPFKRSLLVDIRDSPASALTSYWAAYVTSHTEQYGEPDVYVDDHYGQPVMRERAEFGTGEDRYTVDRLIGPVLQCEVQLSSDYYLPGEPIEGAVLLRSRMPWSEEPLAWIEAGTFEDVTLHVRPHGYRRTLDDVHVGVVEGRRDFVYEPANDLIRGSAFEIVAALPAFMNIPAVFFRV